LAKIKITMNQKIKQIIIAVVVIVIAFIGFKMFFGSSTSNDKTLTADNAVDQQFVDGQAVLNLLNALNKVTLNDAIFSSAVFKSLVSFARPIPDQVPGRTNPFAPIGSDGSTVRVTSTPRTN